MIHASTATYAAASPAYLLDPIALQELVEGCLDVILLVEADFTIAYATPSSFLTFGWRPDELVGRSVFELLAANEHGRVQTEAPQVHAENLEYVTRRAQAVRRDGVEICVESTIRRMSHVGGPARSVVVMRDITERKRLEDELAQFALVDGLTSLANRRAFDRDFEMQLALAERHGEPLLQQDIGRHLWVNLAMPGVHHVDQPRPAVLIVALNPADERIGRELSVRLQRHLDQLLDGDGPAVT